MKQLMMMMNVMMMMKIHMATIRRHLKCVLHASCLKRFISCNY